MPLVPTAGAKAAGLLAAALAAAALAGALIAQYGFDLYPCLLCHYQRWAHIAALGFGLLAVAAARHRVGPWLAWLAVAGLLASAAIALFHLGVEAEWWKGFENCSTPDFSGGMSREQIKQAILTAPVVSCDQVPFRFLGLSMAGWNLIYSLAAAALAGWLLCRKGATR